MSITRTITRDQAEEWDLSYDAPGELHRERLEERRWYSVNLVVFTAPDDGQVWGAVYRQGLTENQEDTDPWNDASTVTLTRYESYERTVTAWRPVAAEPAANAEPDGASADLPLEKWAWTLCTNANESAAELWRDDDLRITIPLSADQVELLMGKPVTLAGALEGFPGLVTPGDEGQPS